MSSHEDTTEAPVSENFLSALQLPPYNETNTHTKKKTGSYNFRPYSLRREYSHRKLSLPVLCKPCPPKIDNKVTDPYNVLKTVIIKRTGHSDKQMLQFN